MAEDRGNMALEEPETRGTARASINLDGRTLEGGGQLVRIAVALSTLTGKPVVIDHIRGNRQGKRGLKNSHLAAIKSLVEMSGSTVKGAQVHSSSLILSPPSHEESTNITPPEDGRLIESGINIRLPTAGSVFLVFQALYPYLLHTGSTSSVGQPIRLSITGGTNVSFAPSYDYVTQVLIPNFALCGLPRLGLELETRGWSAGPSNLGKVTFLVDPLPRDCRDNCENRTSTYRFPLINLNQYRRGAVSQIDITILAPNNGTREESGGKQKGPRKGKRDYPNSRSTKRSNFHRVAVDDQDDFETQSESTGTLLGFIEREIRRCLRKQLKKLPLSIFSVPETDLEGVPDSEKEPIVPIKIHTTEATHHRSYLYVLIVAHTSTGFKIGHDALFGSQRPGEKPRHKGQDGIFGIARDLVEDCVDGFIEELYDPRLQKHAAEPVGHQPCVDQYMRDQLVVFEALGRASGHKRNSVDAEDERYWSLHTKTAQWVCRQLLGDGIV